MNWQVSETAGAAARAFDYNRQALMFAADLATIRASGRMLTQRKREARNARPPRVLISSADGRLRLLIVATLAGEGFDITEASTNHQAIESVLVTPPRLVILESHEGDVGTCSRLRQAMGQKNPHILLITQQKQEQWAPGEHGPDQYLTRPFSPLRLLEHIDRAIGPH